MKKILTALGIFLATSAIAEDEKYFALCSHEQQESYIEEAEAWWVKIDPEANMFRVENAKIVDSEIISMDAKIIEFTPDEIVYAETDLTDTGRIAFRLTFFNHRMQMMSTDYTIGGMQVTFFQCIEDENLHIPSRD